MHYTEVIVKYYVEGEEKTFIDIKKLICFLNYQILNDYNLIECDATITKLCFHKAIFYDYE